MVDRTSYPLRQPWRAMLAASWSEEAARRSELLGGADHEATASWARHVFARAGVAGSRRIDARGDDARWELVAVAAQTLEACAALWHAFGPAAGTREVHLVRCLERRLAGHERSVLALEAGYRLDRRCFHEPAQAADHAIGQLRQRTGDVASALEALERASLSLAGASIRAVQNIDATGCADGHAGRARPPDQVRLHVRFVEIRAHADALGDRRHADDVATWLSESLVITTPAVGDTSTGSAPEAPGAVPRPQGGDLRRRWLRLGARELLIVRAVPGLPPAQPKPSSGAAVCARAAEILADTGLPTRADALDAPLAWAYQAAALGALIPVCARALDGSGEAARCVHNLLADRLARVVSVLWLIDHATPPSGPDVRAPRRPVLN